MTNLQEIISNKSLTREKTIALINEHGKRDEFLKLNGGRTPEEYFEEYHYLEPEIWQNVLNDLGLGHAYGYKLTMD